MKVNANNKAEAECFLFLSTDLLYNSLNHVEIFRATQLLIRVWSNMLETIQFDAQNRYLTIFCNFAALQRTFPFRGLLCYLNCFALFEKVATNVSKVVSVVFKTS